MCHVLVLASVEALDGEINLEKPLTESIKAVPGVRNVFLDAPIGPGIRQLMIYISENPRDVADVIEDIREKGEKIGNPKKFNIRDWITKEINDIIREIMGGDAVFEIKILEDL